MLTVLEGIPNPSGIRRLRSVSGVPERSLAGKSVLGGVEEFWFLVLALPRGHDQ